MKLHNKNRKRILMIHAGVVVQGKETLSSSTENKVTEFYVIHVLRKHGNPEPNAQSVKEKLKKLEKSLTFRLIKSCQVYCE